MSKVEVKLNTAGVGELLKSAEAMAVCEQYANNAQARLGDGYIVTTYVGKTRVNASVYAESKAARKENMESNSILRALI